MTITSTRHRPLYRIAFDIGQNWERPYFGAVPYLDAMKSLDQISEDFGADSGRKIVLSFLSNSSTWRGTTAVKVKSELKQIARVK